MNIVPIINVKASVVFRADALPVVNPSDPQFMLDLEGIKITVKVSPKAARKLASHEGGVVLQGKLAVQGGSLVLMDAGFNWLDPKPASEVEASTTNTTGKMKLDGTEDLLHT